MSVFATLDDQSPDRFGSGFAGAVALHILIAAVCIGLAIVVPGHVEHWGENASTVGAIQASMVSAIPLPSKVAPVEKSVLASENTTPAPKPPPKEATQPPAQTHRHPHQGKDRSQDTPQGRARRAAHATQASTAHSADHQGRQRRRRHTAPPGHQPGEKRHRHGHRAGPHLRQSLRLLPRKSSAIRSHSSGTPRRPIPPPHRASVSRYSLTSTATASPRTSASKPKVVHPRSTPPPSMLSSASTTSAPCPPEIT